MSKAKTAVGVDPRVLRALGHPLRQQILLILNLRVASPTEVAGELAKPLTNIAYHMKILRDNEAIELVETKPVRGAVEHFYRATMRPHLDDAHWARLPKSSRIALFDQTLQQIWTSVAGAARDQGLEELRTHISSTRLELDEQAFGELVDAVNGLVEVAIRLQAESVSRQVKIPSSERRTHKTEMALLHFHRPGAD